MVFLIEEQKDQQMNQQKNRSLLKKLNAQITKLGHSLSLSHTHTL